MEKVIKQQVFGNMSIQLIYSDVPVFGGNYKVVSKTRDFINAEKDGLCLDAAIEVFIKSVNYIATQKVLNTIGK
jgi:hypothetical protein